MKDNIHSCICVSHGSWLLGFAAVYVGEMVILLALLTFVAKAVDFFCWILYEEDLSWPSPQCLHVS